MQLWVPHSESGLWNSGCVSTRRQWEPVFGVGNGGVIIGTETLERDTRPQFRVRRCQPGEKDKDEAANGVQRSRPDEQITRKEHDDKSKERVNYASCSPLHPNLAPRSKLGIKIRCATKLRFILSHCTRKCSCYPLRRFHRIRTGYQICRNI